ncbi:MAG TPA: heparan-alpha-glucosaminide N-acetyltransferase domain-containing protein [Terriglobales bacterium]|nr:heparan-alpha-glucosaminide N-acetyltransferase domain-containing protein [Terriglobales bacterium]
MNSARSSRLGYIDWLRGLACVLMFQTHCYDAWLGGQARDSKVFTWSQLGGTFPAPLFLFLAGISFAIVIEKLRQKNLTANQIAEKTIKRGAEILALGFLFRLQEYAIALGWAPWTDLFRVDILNTIGVSLMLLGVMCWIVLAIAEKRNSGRPRPGKTANLVVTAALTTIVISGLTPLLWTKWRPHFLPWELETYINGVHNLGQPQSWLFPVFPWAGFAFAGLSLGFLLMSPRAKKIGAYAFLAIAAGGIVLVFSSKFLDLLELNIYPVYDYWRTSPSFFIIRIGMLLLMTTTAYAWCRWGPGERGFSPMIQLGRTSLLVYWFHIELVYGKFSILPHRSQNVFGASEGLLAIFIGMLALSLLRTKLRGPFDWPAFWRRDGAQPTPIPSGLAK